MNVLDGCAGTGSATIAFRESRTPGSTQGMKNARDRGMVPRGLSESIAAACHAAVGA